MGMNLPNLRAMVVDGRRFLASTSQHYDVIIVDAYIPPYIPFQLTTVEFFSLVNEHLAEDGVVALNVARTETDYALVDAIAFTLHQVFPSVYLMDTQSNLNTVVVASKQPTGLDTITATLSDLEHPNLQSVAARAAGRIREFTATEGQSLVDDHAPVEQITHAIVARYLLGGTRAR
jgi:spermidine synthase